MIPRACYTRIAFVLVAFGCSMYPPSRAQSAPPHATSKTGSAPGQQIFASVCAGCHGLDGQGAERAPNLATNPKLQQLSDVQISAIVANGVRGTAMPPFRSLGAPAIRSVVSYLRTLRSVRVPGVLPADAADGKSLFFGKAQCSLCHTADGAGGFWGAELSAYGATHSPEEVRGAILDPAKNTDWQRKDLVAVTAEGQSISGIARNQDNFSLQLQSSDGELHFLQKSELRSLEHQSKPVMPADYASRLSAGEIDHLVSYLVSLGAKKKPETGPHDEE
jgi:cytochrome c oxidase cbb3-type subunit III